LIKVVLDGLKVNYASKKQKTTIYITWPPLLIYSLFYYKQLKLRLQVKRKGAIKRRKYLIFGSGRTVSNDDQRLFYFDKLINELGRENCLIVLERPCVINTDKDFELKEFQSIRYNISIKKHARLLWLLKKFVKKIERNNELSVVDKYNIKIACQVFF
jgi:hypothetical protein